MNTLPLWLQITGIVIGVLGSIAGVTGAVLGILNVVWRRRDRQSRLKIDYYLGANPPRAWAREARLAHTSTPYPVVMFSVENVGVRDESLSDVYITLRDGREVHPFSAGNPPMPKPLQPGFPLLFYVELLGLSRELVDRGCTGTARFDLVIRLGRGDLKEKRVEIPDVEARAEGREPG